MGRRPYDSPEVRERLGYMPEHDCLPPGITAAEFLSHMAQVSGLPPAQARTRAADILRHVGLEEERYRPIGQYSTGMKQRVKLGQALVHDPEVLVLDEPLSGADPRQRLQYHAAMVRLAQEGRTVLVSSHILEEVELLADRIILMVSGKLAAAGDIRAIREKLDEQAYKVRIVTDDPRGLAAALVRLEEVDSVNLGADSDLIVPSRNVAVLQESIPRMARELGARLFRIEPLDESLESIFGYVVDR